MKEQNDPEAYEKLKELSPGDIIRELWEGEEVARYLVINRHIRWPKKNYSYQEYSCIINLSYAHDKPPLTTISQKSVYLII